MYSMVILVNNTVSYLKVTKRVNHNSCYHKKKKLQLCVVTDVN